MQRQRKKQDALIYKLLPKDIVAKLGTGEATAENFTSSTLFAILSDPRERQTLST